MSLRSDNGNQGEQRTPVTKTGGDWVKPDNDTPIPPNANVITLAQGITYYSANEGIFLNLKEPAGKVKLFSLTGEVVWQGNLVQGRFLIPTRQGIYFLRINNKSYKLIRK
ncbi:MAG: T9SS type A sorting domain-containing protein [Paludibacteraceae bacterium]|nr:T9SS type A sorting domain-containing protein [Paludibacteraceae bacterium]